MKTVSEKEKAIKAYKAISEGKVTGVRLHKSKVIRYGSITFVID